MTDETKRTGGEPVYDTDRAWARFEKLAAGEPVSAIWKQAEEAPRSDDIRTDGKTEELEDQVKGGADMRKQTENLRIAEQLSAVAATGAGTIGEIKANGAWRTERPAKRRLRRLTAMLGAAVVAVGLFTTPLGDRALAAMMQTFRIQHLVGVGITADDMSTISGLLEKGSPEGDRSFNLAQYGSLTQSGGGESRSVTWEEAEKQMGASLLRPDDSHDLSFQPGTALTFRLNVKTVNRLLTRLGSATTLPDEADGKAIELRIPDGVIAEGSLSGKPVRLLQFGKPELNVENGIDPATVREAVLGLPVLPDSLRSKLAAIGDWRNTLPVPAQDGVMTNLRMDGHDAIMTVDGGHRLLLWLDGNRMSLLSGDLKDFPAEADLLGAARELIQP